MSAVTLATLLAGRPAAPACDGDAEQLAIAQSLYVDWHVRSIVCGEQLDGSEAGCDARVFEQLLSFRRVLLRDRPPVAAYFVQPVAPFMSLGYRGDPEETEIWLFAVDTAKPRRVLTFTGDSLDLTETARVGFRRVLGVADTNERWLFEWDGANYQTVKRSRQHK